MITFVYLLVLVLVIAGLVALGRKHEMTDEEYEERRGKQSAIGNALLDVQRMLEPDRDALKRAREERKVEKDESGDPPDPSLSGPESSGG